MIRFFRHVGLVSSAQLAAGCIAFTYTIVSARILGVENYGLFQSVMGIYYAFSLFFNMPLSLAVTHCVGVEKDEQKRGELLGDFLRLTLISTGILAVIVLGLSGWMREALHAESRTSLAGVAVLLVTTGILTAFQGSLQGRLWYGLYAVLKIAEAVFVLVIGWLLLSAGMGVSGAVWAYPLSMSLMMLYYFYRRDLVRSGGRFGELKRELKPLVSIVAVFGVLLLVDNLPVILARARLDAETSGLFGSLYNLRNMLWPVAYAVTTPFYSHLFESENRRGLFSRALLLVSVLGAAFSLVGVTAARPLFSLLYGSAFAGASVYMPLYGIVLLLEMVCLVCLLHDIAEGSMHYAVLGMMAAVFAVGAGIGSSLPALMTAQGAACVSSLLLRSVLRTRFVQGFFSQT